MQIVTSKKEFKYLPGLILLNCNIHHVINAIHQIKKKQKKRDNKNGPIIRCISVQLIICRHVRVSFEN
jgi:hypothetical protein